MVLSVTHPRQASIVLRPATSGPAALGEAGGLEALTCVHLRMNGEKRKEAGRRGEDLGGSPPSGSRNVELTEPERYQENSPAWPCMGPPEPSF